MLLVGQNKMTLIKAKFEGEALVDADDIDCVKGWLECNPDICKGEYIKITKIDKIN